MRERAKPGVALRSAPYAHLSARLTGARVLKEQRRVFLMAPKMSTSDTEILKRNVEARL
jgi:hypothetical protein